MGKLLFQFRKPAGPVTLDTVRDEFKLAPGDLDSDYGVIEIDPEDHLYSVLVDESAVGKLHLPGISSSRGEVFGNPRVEPFGPVQ